LRFNYFQSLARPSFRELSSVELLDFELRANLRGNNELKVVDVRNYDLRLESYFKNGDNVSLSLFYKDFKNHIELIQTPGIATFSWENAPKSQAFGVEVEGKKQLTKHFDIRGNFSFIDSETTITTPVMKTRRMFGQAPYIVNTTLSYEHDSLGFNASVSYNIQGPKIAAVVNAAVAQPDIIEIPRHVIDVNLNKRFGRHYSVGIRIRNLINAPFRRAYDFDAGYLLDFDNIRWGPVYNLSFTYRL
jgi:outer membrane receptor protein involved in Fe transport